MDRARRWEGGIVTPSRIAELRALAAGATPGPWKAESWDNGTARELIDVITDEVRVAGYAYKPDAEYIAAAANAVPELCDEIERLTRELREAREALAEFAGQYQRAAGLGSGAPFYTADAAAFLTYSLRGFKATTEHHAATIRAAEKENGR
jgi:hypothetical protein